MADLRVVGRSHPRVDGLEKVTGAARFSPDVKLPRMIVGKILRSPHPHAKILHINASRALRLPGIKAVVTAEDTPKAKVNSAATYYFEERGAKNVAPTPMVMDQTVFCGDVARFVGDEVAAVAAVDEETALEALSLIKVDYELLPPLFDPLKAMEPGAPLLHEAERNIAYKFVIRRGDVEKGFAEAHVIHEDTYTTQLQHQAYLGPTACVADVDGSGRVLIWTELQSPFRARRLLCDMLGLPAAKVRVFQTHVGGGFGGKHFKRLQPISALLALKARRPVRLCLTREEEFMSSPPRHATHIRLKMGASRDGTLVAKETHIVLNSGAYGEVGPIILDTMTKRVDTLYRFTNIKTDSFLVYTNTVPGGAFRGFGNPPMDFALESHMDMLAEKLAMDPVELRLKNARRVGEISAHGWEVKSCALTECIEKAADAARWKEKRAKHKLAGGKARGVGIGCMIHVSGCRYYPGFYGSNAVVTIGDDGQVYLFSGESELGQGCKTVMAQIVAEELGICLEDIVVPDLDTDFSPYSLGAYADRTTHIGGNATRLAAIDARAQLFEFAAEMLEADPADLVARDRKIFPKGSPQRAVTFQEVARRSWFHAGGKEIVGRGSFDPPSVPPDPETQYGNVSSAYTFGAQIAEVEVDRKTGKVTILNFAAAHDVGKAINPMAVEGQIQGALVQGAGYGLMEDMVGIDGRTYNPNFLNYRLPSIMDVPAMNVMMVESNDPVGPYGAKGVAEPALVATAPALANAIYHAVGARITSLPITPQKILAALEAREPREKGRSE
ncbi:MAG: molybdopterin-dependent oxidoreductase [Deltaproteobacteria bacterium]|nr:molybdopterin-dependent oxidoreductase [Deltaproteobacteria bacterium]